MASQKGLAAFAARKLEVALYWFELVHTWARPLPLQVEVDCCSTAGAVARLPVRLLTRDVMQQVNPSDTLLRLERADVTSCTIHDHLPCRTRLPTLLTCRLEHGSFTAPFVLLKLSPPCSAQPATDKPQGNDGAKVLTEDEVAAACLDCALSMQEEQHHEVSQVGVLPVPDVKQLHGLMSKR